MNSLIRFIKAHTVFVVSFLFALISVFFNAPSKQYFSFIDFNTLCILFSLMAVVGALESCGVFVSFASFILSRVSSLKILCAVLVYLCFFWSMFITNDVALITFVPFAIMLLHNQKNVPVWILCYVVVLQTIAANTGSMLTPTGNPQNLFLFEQSGFTLTSFILLLLPYTLFCAAGLGLCILIIPDKKLNKSMNSGFGSRNTKAYSNMTLYKILYAVLFILCLLSVAKIIPKPALAVVVLILFIVLDRKILLKVDYYLLFTFVFFFIFTGNLQSISFVKSFLQNCMAGHEFIVSVAASQVISNVPATLMLYNFTDNITELLFGVNVGGLGTLVASLASLISFNIYTTKTGKAGLFMLYFTGMNVLFLALLITFKLFAGALFI